MVCLGFTFGNVELVTIDNSKSNDFPIEELKIHTLREVFQNRNIVMPNLSIATDLGDGNYELSVVPSISNLIYNVYNGTYNSIISPESGGIAMRNFVYNLSGTYTLSIYGDNSNIRLEYQVDDNDWIAFAYSNVNLFNYQSIILTATTSIGFRFRALGNGIKQENIRIKLEKGTQATPYQLPTNQSYSDIDVGGLELTNQQIDDWFNVYQENSEREISDTYDYIENELTTNDLIYIVLFALLWGLGFRISKGVVIICLILSINGF